MRVRQVTPATRAMMHRDVSAHLSPSLDPGGFNWREKNPFGRNHISIVISKAAFSEIKHFSPVVEKFLFSEL